MVKAYVELQPSRFREKIEEQARIYRNFYEMVHVPDAPLGYPKASTLAIGAILVQRGLNTTLHVRVADYDETSLLNFYYGAYLLGVKRILVLRGDPPVYGRECSLLDTVQAVRLFYGEERLREKMQIGVLLSTRYPVERIEERLELPVDFYLIINKDPVKLEHVRERTNKELVGYFIVMTEKNRDIVARLSGRDVVDIEKLRDAIDAYRGLLDAFLFSFPGDYGSALRIQGLLMDS